MRINIKAIFIIFVLGFWAISCTEAREKHEENDSSLPVTTVPDYVISQLPPAEQGFEWHLYKNVIFQLPANWNKQGLVDTSNGFPLSVYAASPEKFSKTKFFEMGATVQVITGSNKFKSIPAKKAAILFLKPFLEEHQSKEDILMFSQSNKGDFENTLFRYRDAPQGQKPIIVHKYVMANDITDSVHIFTFESPETEWNDNWKKYGIPFLSKIIFTSSE